jgi:cellulose/xylan binding protein with CBM9 domain
LVKHELSRAHINLKEKRLLNNSKDRDEGYTVEMQIPWSTTPVRGSTIAADFLSVDHDGNPGRLFDDLKTIFSKISWDGDENVDTAEKGIVLLH